MCRAKLWLQLQGLTESCNGLLVLTALLRNNAQIVIDEGGSHTLAQGQSENPLGGIQVTRPQRCNSLGKLLLTRQRRVLARRETSAYKKRDQRSKDPGSIHPRGTFYFSARRQRYRIS